MRKRRSGWKESGIEMIKKEEWKGNVISGEDERGMLRGR